MLIQDPYLASYSFFSRQDGWSEALAYHEQARQQLQIPATGYDASTLNSNHDSKRRVYLYPQEDTGVVYLSADKGGEQPVQIWSELSVLALGENWSQRPQQETCWGISLFFGATVDTLPTSDQIKIWLAEILLPLIPNRDHLQPVLSRQRWGDVWLLTSRHQIGHTHPQVYLILSTTSQETALNQILTPPTSIDLVELSLHKLCNQLELYHQHRDTWHEHSRQLDNDFKAILRGFREQQAVNRTNLSTISMPYVDLVGWTKQVAALQQTLEINLANYSQAMTDLAFNMDDEAIYTVTQKQVIQAINQIKHDRAYEEITVERIRAGMETIRADLELTLVEAEHQTAHQWRETRLQNEHQEKQETDKERQRDLLLAFIGTVLGATQVWPIIQGLLPKSIQWWADFCFLMIVTLLMVVILGRWWTKQ